MALIRQGSLNPWIGYDQMEKELWLQFFLMLISNSAQVEDGLDFSGASLCCKLVPYSLARTMLIVSQKLRISRQIILDMSSRQMISNIEDMSDY